MTFVVRLQGGRVGIRGQVIEVGTGAARLFEDLEEVVAFIRARWWRSRKARVQAIARSRPPKEDEAGRG